MAMRHHDLMKDAEISTIDGDRVGTVGDVRGDYFQVKPGMGSDYWLSMDWIVSSEAEVKLALRKRDLGANKLKESQIAA